MAVGMVVCIASAKVRLPATVAPIRLLAVSFVCSTVTHAGWQPSAVCPCPCFRGLLCCNAWWPGDGWSLGCLLIWKQTSAKQSAV